LVEYRFSPSVEGGLFEGVVVLVSAIAPIVAFEVVPQVLNRV
jgi:hypothetical protein